MEPSDSFKALYDTVVKLRSPEGCKWDREQSPSSLRGALVEETYECLEAIDENNPEHIAEELGDLFLLAVMISYMHEQEGKFSVADVLQKVNEKLIRRHPHVFGDVKVKDSAEILNNWAKINHQVLRQYARDYFRRLLQGTRRFLRLTHLLNWTGFAPCPICIPQESGVLRQCHIKL